MKRQAVIAVIAVIMILLCGIALGEEETDIRYRTLTQGMTGQDVYLLKVRLYQLGYFKTDRTNNKYTGSVTQAVKELQKANGLEETGAATPALQRLIFSADCVTAAVTPAPTAAPTPSPVPKMPVTTPALPALDEEGFLPQESDEEYVFEDADDGLWYYISRDVYVEIRRYSITGKHPLQWYETTVNLRNGLLPEAYSVPYTKLTSSTFVSPAVLANRHHVVLGISDDTYTWRTYYKRRTGIVIRNGELISHTPYINKNMARFPNLDVMAFLPDGTMAMYENGETTPEALFELGVKNAYSFGPILVKDGREQLLVRYGGASSTAKEPRCAIGMRSPNHFVVLTVVGRARYSEGCRLSWLAEKMIALGTTDAFNLDGGGSASLLFMGKILNKQSAKDVRKITDIIGFGVSGLVGD